MAKGEIVAFKDINDSIQSSLYDLFNKSFYRVGNKRVCRVAVGANSNPRCEVHSDFNAVVFIDEERVPELNAAFLNRFEKHYLRSESILTTNQVHEKGIIMSWVDRLLANTRNTVLKR